MDEILLERISSVCLAPSRSKVKAQRIHELNAVDVQECFFENRCSKTKDGTAESRQYRSKQSMAERVLAVFFNDNSLLKSLDRPVLPPITSQHTDQTDYSALHIAAAMGHSKIIAMLLTDGYHPGQNTLVNGRNAIHLACLHGREEALQILLANGGLDHMNAMDANDETPLQLAVIQGHKSIVDILIRAHCRVSMMLSLPHRIGSRGTPLIHAVVYEQVDIMKKLLRAGAEIDEKGKWGATALHWASRKGNTRIIRYLLSKGADPRVRDTFGCTPSGVAQFGQHSDAANILAMFESRSAYPCGKPAIYSSSFKFPIQMPTFKYLPRAMEGQSHIGKAQQFGAYNWTLDRRSQRISASPGTTQF